MNCYDEFCEMCTHGSCHAQVVNNRQPRVVAPSQTKFVLTMIFSQLSAASYLAAATPSRCPTGNDAYLTVEPVPF
jgi:hypothetical protein